MRKIEILRHYTKEIISVLIGVIILVFNFMFISTMEGFGFLVPILNMVGSLVIVIPPLLIFYSRYRITKEMEDEFIAFIRDLSDSINSGMTLPMALNHCSKRDYGVISSHVNRIASQVDWGISFEKAMMNFADKSRSMPIRRAVSTMIETYRVGGKISDTLNAVTTSLTTIEKIRRERLASVYSQIVTLYIIFFVFIIIMVVLQVFIIPMLSEGDMASIGFMSESESIPIEFYSEIFIYLIIIQGFFAGLVTGKIAEGSLTAGIKHTLILIVLGYSIFTILTQFQITPF